MKKLIVASVVVLAVACSAKAPKTTVDNSFSQTSSSYFSGFNKNATINLTQGSGDFVTVYIRRLGNELFITSKLHFILGNEVTFPEDSYIQISVPKTSLTEKNAFRFVASGDNYIYETSVWLTDQNLDIANIVIDLNIAESSLFLFSFLSLVEPDSIEIDSSIVFPNDGITLESKRIDGCAEKICTNAEIQRVLQKK